MTKVRIFEKTQMIRVPTEVNDVVGLEIPYTLRLVHPDDLHLLYEARVVEAEVLRKARKAGKARKNWKNALDLEIASYDEDPMIKEYCNFLVKYITENYERPELETVSPDTDVSAWAYLPLNVFVRK